MSIEHRYVKRSSCYVREGGCTKNNTSLFTASKSYPNLLQEGTICNLYVNYSKCDEKYPFMF